MHVPFASSRGTTFSADCGAGDGFLLSVFLRDGDEVYRTYTTSQRGVDRLVFANTHARPVAVRASGRLGGLTTRLASAPDLVGARPSSSTREQMTRSNFIHACASLHPIRRVVAAVQKPVNVVMSSADPEITARQLADAGVKRISVGGALSRLAFAAVRDAALAMRDAGTFTWVRDTFPGKDLKAIFRQAPNE